MKNSFLKALDISCWRHTSELPPSISKVLGRKDNLPSTLLSSWLKSCNKRQINKRRINRSLLTWVTHGCMGDTQGEESNPLWWLRIQATILIGKGEGKWQPLREEWVIFRRNEWDLRRIGERYNSLWQSLLGMMWTSSLLSCDKNQSSLVEKTLGKGFMTTEFLLEDLSLGR